VVYNLNVGTRGHKFFPRKCCAKTINLRHGVDVGGYGLEYGVIVILIVVDNLIYFSVKCHPTFWNILRSAVHSEVLAAGVSSDVARVISLQAFHVESR